jgi:hypothetical protein
MKAILRVPTSETYAYIEIECEGTPVEILEHYNYFTRLVKNVGLPTKEWNTALDIYLSTNHLEESQYNDMSLEQQHIIQEIKKAVKRITPKKAKADKDGIVEGVEDLAWEHSQHDNLVDNCSECYKLDNEK